MLLNAAFFTAALAAVASALPTAEPARNATEVEDTSSAHIMAYYGDSYVYYKGNGGHTPDGWPNADFWGTWDQLWNSNVALMRKSCGWNGWGAENSETEIGYIKNAIIQVAGEAGIDKRFILAVIMQESKGCVRVPTTYNGVTNPGLMQSHDGSGSCAGVRACSQAQVLQMIRDGSTGTSYGDGLMQCYAKTSAVLGAKSHRSLFAAARMYNSGSVNYNDMNDGFSSRRCYVCDIANRLTGWTLATALCTE